MKLMRKLLLSFSQRSKLMNPSVKACASAAKFFAELHIAQEGFKGFRKNDMFLDGWKKFFLK